MSFWNSKKVKAKKRHRCLYCGQSIEIGELYSRETGIFEDDFQNFALHLECLAEHHENSKEDNDYTIYPYDSPRPFVNEGINI